MHLSSLALTPVHPAREGPRPMTAEDLWAIPRVGAPSFAPDGRALVVPVTTFDLEKNEGRGRIWRVPLDGGDPVALTSPEAASASPRISPDGRRLAFTRKDDKGKPQLFVLPLDGGEAQRVTSFPLGVFDPTWLPDGSGVVFGAGVLAGHATPEATAAELDRRDKDPVKAHVTEERLYRYWDQWLTTGEVPHLFVHTFAGGATRDLTPDSTAWFDWMDPSGQYDLAPDGSAVAFAGIWFDARRSLIVSSIFLAPRSGGRVEMLTPDPPADHLRPRWTPDGRAIVYGRTLDPEFYADRVRLWHYDVAARRHQPWLEDWDLSPAAWTFAADGTLVIEAEQDGRVRLFRWRGEGLPQAITTAGAAASATARGTLVAYTLQSLAEPAEVHLLDLAGGAARRITRFTGEATAGFATGEVREMRIEGSYGEPVQTFVVFPPGHDPASRPPLVHVIHGGPHGISGDQFHPRWNAQLFAAPGYVAALVNFQGSTSWGQDYAKRIQGAWAERPFEDVMKVTDALAGAGIVDPTRMAAAGGSYGGYMATWIAGHTDRFRCIVCHAGVHDLTGQYASDVTQGRGAAAGGEAWDGLDRQDRWSPIRFASAMTTPMLVIHGERDFRVPVGQGLLLYGLLKAKGVPARLVYFPDENHWVLKPRNSLLWYREVHAWLARWLGA
jgi:dipeptidyl aminopeptidase/acylaminoacyl peptidase